MLKFSKKVEYALIALIYIGERGDNCVTTSREIAEKFHIPGEMMGKILHTLAKKDLITSLQGVKGGYKLQRSLQNISITDVVSILDGPINFVNCSHVTKKSECPQSKVCNIKNGMNVMQTKLHGFFSSITLADLQQDYTHVLDIANSV